MIELLPENVANQIAAGEVIQRPASAVKELIENAVDAQSSKIQLIIKDAGSTLVQVIDNGTGMNRIDAELCFKKHATSKIKTSKDLFSISSKGFRGEALSSIGAVAQVELKTKKKEDDIGHQVKIEASKIISSESCACNQGTNISMKNLFYNVPARRNFLKSNGVETKHIIDEFQRVALSHPEIHFTMHHNKSLIFDLQATKRRQRIVGVFGKKYNERLVPVNEHTSITTINGYILKPEFSKRTRGEQFLFVNNRYIKNNSINHAIKVVYKDLISHDQFPSYFIHLTVPADSIDVNIHPSKIEIKFEDERSIYELVKSSVRSALSKNNIAPSIDFNLETSFDLPPLKSDSEIKFPTINVNPNYNPFKRQKPLDVQENINLIKNNFEASNNLLKQDQNQRNSYLLLQLGSRYIITVKKNGLLVIDVFRAHQQVKFEQLIERYKNGEVSSQKLLHPIEIELNSSDFTICLEIKEELQRLGVEIDQFGRQSIVVNTFPSIDIIDVKSFMEKCIENFKNSNHELDISHHKIAWDMATSYAHKTLKNMDKNEMVYLIDCLFSCKNSTINSKGLTIVKEITQEEINKKFS